MGKRNQYIDQIVAREISRLILEGKLYTKEMVDADLLANVELWAKIWTIAINRGLKVGKKRIEEKVNPVVDELLEDLYRRKDEDNGDQTHAISVIERMYDQIMEE
jgi:hypothetical protein